MEDFVVNSDDHQSRMAMLKRKRTQRQKSLSPYPTVTTTSASASSSGGGIGVEGETCSTPINIIGDETITYETTTATTEEEEDMANCLILLAQSGGDNNCDDGLVTENHRRRKSVDVGIFTNGLYGYECRTCNKTFNSFQALGGHRASHKKPKSVLSEEMKTFDHPLQHYQNQNQNAIKKIKISNNTTTNVTLSLLHGTTLFNKTSSKSHECSICGSEFSSGQALGGHMRRHRTLTTSQIITGEHKNHENDKKQQNVLSLDLNLPAPDDGDDDRNNSMFHILSTPTLVDCHY